MVVLIAAIVAATGSGCVTMAPPPPMATFGGPETVRRGASEVGLAAGSGGQLFPGAHATGHAWFGRWRYGVTDRLDLGVDLMGVQHAADATVTAKGAARYALRPRLRVEAGLGAADDSQGKSLHGDAGVTTGTLRPDATWNFYTSLRAAAARGYPGRVCCQSGATGDAAPPNSIIALGAIGATARVVPGIRFVVEGGYGPVWVKGRHDSGEVVYLGMGLLLDVGKTSSTR